MKYRDFGKTGIKVSEIGFGGWAIGGSEHGNSYGPTNDKESLEAIHKAIDQGCNFFDTADVYGWGHSEELLGKALKGKRDHLIIATKVGGDFYQGNGFQTFTPDYIRFALAKSLERLRTDYLDVYQLHNPPLKLLNRPETYEVLKELKREGKIRAWGVSIFDVVEGMTALRVGQPDSLQAPYNIFSGKAASDLFPKAFETGCAIIAREPLANGFLTNKYEPNSQFDVSDIRHNWPREYVLARMQAANKLHAAFKGNTRTLGQTALKFVLANEQVSVVVVGTKTAQQAEENMSASDLPHLTADDCQRIADLQGRGFQ
ncbi:MAG TPA: aldo/keto reductase [Chroococcales cyanobacterium]